MPQWAVAGCPGHTGHVSPAALSHTVKMKSIRGASGVANTVQLFEAKPLVGSPKRSSSSSASRCTSPFGRLPAENALNRPSPSLLRIASAIMDRAEFPVHKKSTLNTPSGARRSFMERPIPQRHSAAACERAAAFVRRARLHGADEGAHEFALHLRCERIHIDALSRQEFARVFDVVDPRRLDRDRIKASCPQLASVLIIP